MKLEEMSKRIHHEPSERSEERVRRCWKMNEAVWVQCSITLSSINATFNDPSFPVTVNFTKIKRIEQGELTYRNKKIFVQREKTVNKLNPLFNLISTFSNFFKFNFRESISKQSDFASQKFRLSVCLFEIVGNAVPVVECKSLSLL